GPGGGGLARVARRLVDPDDDPRPGRPPDCLRAAASLSRRLRPAGPPIIVKGFPSPSGACMQSENRFLDDLARLFAGAAGNVASLRHELETKLREHAERLLRGMDLVSREEFAAVEAMAAKARAEQVALE